MYPIFVPNNPQTGVHAPFAFTPFKEKDEWNMKYFGDTIKEVRRKSCFQLSVNGASLSSVENPTILEFT